MSLGDLSTLGSFGGGAAGVGLGVKYLTESWRHRRSGRQTQQEETTATVTDAATANATLVATLQETQRALRAERSQNRAKDKRIDDLEERCDALREQMADQRDEYDERIRAAREAADIQIREMQEKLTSLTWELGELRRRIGTAEGLPQ